MISSNTVKRIAMPSPFAHSGDIATIGSQPSQFVNYTQGFPSQYGAPASNGGKFVKRSEINAIGNLATNDLFYHKCGGLNTFDPEFAAAIGGYPKGAVLQYLAGNKIWYVLSMVENNTFNFVDNGVDEVNWIYCNIEMPSIDSETISLFTPSQTLVPSSITTSSTQSIATRQWNDFYTGSENVNTYGIGTAQIVGQFVANRSGSIYVTPNLEISPLNSGKDAVALSGSETNFSAQMTTGTTLNTFGGIGIMIKDVGSTPSAVVAAPTISTVEDWTIIYSDRLSILYSLGNIMQVPASYPAVTYGHYYKVAIVSYGTYSYQSEGKTIQHASPAGGGFIYNGTDYTNKTLGVQITGGSFTINLS